ANPGSPSMPLVDPFWISHPIGMNLYRTRVASPHLPKTWYKSHHRRSNPLAQRLVVNSNLLPSRLGYVLLTVDWPFFQSKNIPLLASHLRTLPSSKWIDQGEASLELG